MWREKMGKPNGKEVVEKEGAEQAASQESLGAVRLVNWK